MIARSPLVRDNAGVSVETTLLFIFAGVAVVVAVRWFADRTGLPAAALLTLIGILYAVLPGPNIELDPHLVLTLILPPLLYNAALDSSLLDIRRNLRTVISLSVVLVIVTALVVGVGFHFFVAGATMAAGVALGAAVAPPDPVAALAVGKRVGLPRKIVTLVQGEGLLNDATALTLLSVAVAAAVGGEFSFPHAVGDFFMSAAGGVVAGIVVAYAVRATRRIQHDPIIANAISLVTPFVAYVLAEEVHVSGVLAVVVAGLIVGHDTPRLATGASRLQVSAVWRLVDFLLEGLVFLLIGQQLPWVIEGLSDYETSTIIIAVAISVGAVLILRPLFLMLTQLLPPVMHARLGGDPDSAEGTSKRERALNGKEINNITIENTKLYASNKRVGGIAGYVCNSDDRVDTGCGGAYEKCSVKDVMIAKSATDNSWPAESGYLFGLLNSDGGTTVYTLTNCRINGKLVPAATVVQEGAGTRAPYTALNVTVFCYGADNTTNVNIVCTETDPNPDPVIPEPDPTPVEPEQPAHTNRRYPATTTTTETPAKGNDVTSAKTIDGGVALYVGMALTSTLGMAWMGKKRAQ